MKGLLSIVFSVSIVLGVNAQRLIDLNVTISPQHAFFVHAFKFDFELGKSMSKKHKIVLTPIFQVGPVNQFGGASTNAAEESDGTLLDGKEGPDNILGYGLGVSHRMYMITGVKENSKHGFYLSYGGAFLKSKINYSTLLTENETVGGVVFTNKNEVDGVDTFDRLSLETMIGDRLLLGKFILDFYFGVGFKSTKTESSNPGSREYDRNIYDFGFSGIHPLMGVKVGFKIL